jgi:hypothetical protein
MKKFIPLFFLILILGCTNKFLGGKGGNGGQGGKTNGKNGENGKNGGVYVKKRTK